MKHFGAVILQLDAVSLNTVLQAVKQAICPNTQFFDSLSLHPSIIVDEMFQRGNQYSMREDDIVVATKQTITSTSKSRSYDGNK